MTMPIALQATKRRNLQALRVSLRALEPGEQATAVFRTGLCGTYAVSGLVVRSCATEGLLIGGQTLDTSSATANPVPELIALAAPVTETDATPEELGDALADLHHGDLVEAGFHQPPYGRLTVVGFAIDAPVGAVMVLGGLRLTRRSCRNPAALITTLHRLADADPARHRVPAPINRWPEADAD
ncbi:hypothetical protein [Nocardia mangyaensis]|uniref:hypothetical protein n=1 Tax=Nocardia mangyaensis TaxID=2213200 RepID=UPI002674EB4C|nr:hypothetical protein [Nocardia mangyaensis]MDO3650811.1 hypothetical protein [Nocardia mangyaensis]